MLWSNLEAFAHVAAGLGAVIQSVLLSRGPKLERRVGGVLLVLGLSMVARGVNWALPGEHPSLMRFFIAGFGLLPLLTGLMVEALVRRPLPLLVKLVLLVGTVGFVGAVFVPGTPMSYPFGVAQAGFLMLTFAMLGAVLARAWVRAKPGPSRSLYAGFALVGLLAPPFVFTDSSASWGLDLPHLGSVPTVLLVYFGGTALSSVGTWSLAHAVTRLGWAVGAVTLAVAAWALVSGASLEQSAAMALCFLVLYLNGAPLSLALLRAQSRLDVLLARLSNLDHSSLRAMVDDLTRWPELERVVIVGLDDVPDAEIDRLVAQVERDGPVVHRAKLAQQLVLQTDHDALLALEHLQLLLDGHHVDALAFVDRTCLLGARFAPGLQASVHQQLWAVIGAMGRLVVRGNPA